MEIICTLTKTLAEGIFFGIVTLVFASLLLPDSLFAKILRKVKPDFVSRTLLIQRFRTVLDYLLNKKNIILPQSSDSKSCELEMMNLIKQKDQLESNLFFLDLLRGLAKMIHFSVTQAGFKQADACGILDASMNYIQHYAREIQNNEISGNQAERIDLAAGRLQTALAGADAIVDPAHLDMLKKATELNAHIFDSFISNEYSETKTALSNVNQLLADRLMDYIGQEK